MRYGGQRNLFIVTLYSKNIHQIRNHTGSILFYYFRSPINWIGIVNLLCMCKRTYGDI